MNDTPQFPPPNLFRLILRRSPNDWHFEQLDRVLDPIGAGIRACADFIEESGLSGDDEYADAMTDNEVEVIEGLLGAAFVVCQTQIERVAHAVELLHWHAEHRRDKKPPVSLKTTGTSKGSVMAYGSAFVALSGVTQVQALNTVANYFKHRDSWSPHWESFIESIGAEGKKAANGDKQTAAAMNILLSLGLRSGSNGNLRTAANILGNVDFAQVHMFSQLLKYWQSNLFQGYERELGGLGLL